MTCPCCLELKINEMKLIFYNASAIKVNNKNIALFWESFTGLATPVREKKNITV